MTPRRCPRLARLRTCVDLKRRELVLTMEGEGEEGEGGGGRASSQPLVVPLDEFGETSSSAAAGNDSRRALASLASSWLTAALGMPCLLARAPSGSKRGWANEGDLLLVGRRSLAALRDRFATANFGDTEESAAASAAAASAASAPERFRPNLVVDRLDANDGMAPHEEDSWESLRGFGGGGGSEEGGGEQILLVAAGGCARCPAVNIDRSSSSPCSSSFSSSRKGGQQQQPLLELAGYRRSVRMEGSSSGCCCRGGRV